MKIYSFFRVKGGVGKTILTILTAFAEYEHNCINERIREVNQTKLVNNPDSIIVGQKKYKKVKEKML